MTVSTSPAPETTYRVTSPERHNAKAWARKFEARLLEPGIISYEDMGCGKAYLTRETIENSAHTFIGRPLILTPKLRHKKVAPKDLEKEARGYITDTYWGPDGWLWAKGICHDDEAKEAINRVGFCSCAYDVVRAGTGGEYHAIPYHEEILEFSGEHLAIVDKPRYEGATIRLNSKTKNTMNPIKWIKKIASRQNATEAPAAPAAAAPAAPAKIEQVENTQAEEITGATELEIPTRENGKTEKVTLETLVEAYNARNDGISAEDSVEVDGKPVVVSELIAGYKANAMETDEEKTKRENSEKEKEDEEKKNKKNAAPAAPQHFKVLLNARNSMPVLGTANASPDDIMSRVNRGSERYGSSKPAVHGKN